MGNKLGRKRQAVDERYTRPQGLDFDIDVDIKKLRKLILESKLAPCYPGDEECCCDLEECPICFLYYPSLNRSRCCTKSICTECFLQMKNPNSTRPTQCPFCKTPNYAVEYRGVKTKEEKGIEQIEEQRVIEAQLRMRQQELQDEEERMQKRRELCSSSGAAPGEVQDSSVSAHSNGEEEGVYSEALQDASMIKQPVNSKAKWDDEFDLDLEDIMVTEAIWQSIQDNSRQRDSFCRDAASSVQYVSGDRYISPAMTTMAGSSSSSSASDRLVCTVAAFTEHEQMTGEPSPNYNVDMPSFNMLPSSGQFYNRLDRVAGGYPPGQSLVDMSADVGMTPARDDGEWGIDHRSDVAEAGTSYAGSDVREDVGVISTIPQYDEIRGSFHNVPDPIVTDCYEDQMMMAMTISLAEGTAMTRGVGVTWQ